MTTASRLIVNDISEYEWHLAWFFPDESDIGGSLGDDEYTPADLAKETDPENRETIAAALAVKSLASRRDAIYGYIFDSKRQAHKALAIAKAAIKQAHSKTPWPDWATKAAAAGWKPPKGWKP